MFGQGLATLAVQNNTSPEDKKNAFHDLYDGFPILSDNEEKLKLDDLYRPENMQIMRDYIIDVSGKQTSYEEGFVYFNPANGKYYHYNGIVDGKPSFDPVEINLG